MIFKCVDWWVVGWVDGFRNVFWMILRDKYIYRYIYNLISTDDIFVCMYKCISVYMSWRMGVWIKIVFVDIDILMYIENVKWID